MAGSSISFWILSIAGSIKLLTPGLDNTRLSGAHCFCLSIANVNVNEEEKVAAHYYIF